VGDRKNRYGRGVSDAPMGGEERRSGTGRGERVPTRELKELRERRLLLPLKRVPAG